MPPPPTECKDRYFSFFRLKSNEGLTKMTQVPINVGQSKYVCTAWNSFIISITEKEFIQQK